MDWAPYRLVFSRYLGSVFCYPYGLFRDSGLVSTGTLIRFGSSAWIAQLITADGYRNRGLGSRMLGFLIGEAVRIGIATLSLVATDQGYPLYAAAGFRVEGDYAFWTRSAPAPAEPGASEGLSALVPGDLGPVADLDRTAVGEDRSPWWTGMAGGGLVWKTIDSPEGFFLPEVGEGLVVARTDRAGIPLLHRRLDGAERCVVPAGHPVAPRVLESRGFAETNRARRMVLGPSLNRNPGWVWSRIAGNLG